MRWAVIARRTGGAVGLLGSTSAATIAPRCTGGGGCGLDRAVVACWACRAVGLLGCVGGVPVSTGSAGCGRGCGQGAVLARWAGET